MRNTWFNYKKRDEKPRSQKYSEELLCTDAKTPLRFHPRTGKVKRCRHLLISDHLERSKRRQKCIYAHVLTFCVVLSEKKNILVQT